MNSSFKRPGLKASGRKETLTTILANGFPYSRKLVGHTSCVNSLAFSSGDGRFLASGGDDLEIRLWDFHQDDVSAPSCSFRGSRGNIFSLAFSATNRYLYSGGTDMMVLKYDVKNIGSHLDTTSVRSPDQTYREHQDIIRGIGCHPYQDEVFLSASQDGRIIQHDGRVDSHSARAQDTIQVAAEVTGAQFHPIMENIFVTSDGHGVVCLRDTRMAFGPLKNRTREGIVQTYNTKLTRRPTSHLSNPEASSVTFDREGSKLAVTMLHYFPTIYALTDPHPVAVCSGRNNPDGTAIPPGEKSYANTCTIKHGSFGGPGLDDDEFYCAGSEDFRTYIWEVPKLNQLIEHRREINAKNWVAGEWPNTIAFTEGPESPCYLPVELHTPLCRLTGHRSIVNSTIIHPHLLHVVTSGIEKDILLHGPTPNSPCSKNLQQTPKDARIPSSNFEEDRSLYFRALAGIHSDALDDDDREGSERITIRMFDHILREEGEVDLFETRRWRGDSSDEEDKGDDSDDEDYGI